MKRKKLFLIFAICALLAGIVASGGYLFNRHVILPVRQQGDVQQLKDLLDPAAPLISLVPILDDDKFTDNSLESLQNINSDICGWIRFENLPIDYPIVQTTDNDFYLTHDYKKQSSRYGAIFLDARCQPDSQNKSLHGHNMDDGSMFASLLQLTDYETYQKNKTFTTLREDGKVCTWEIVSVFRINPERDDFFYLQPDFASEQDFMDFMIEVKRRSLFEIPDSIRDTDEFLTLSTCSYEQKNNRTVIVGRRLE